MKYLVTIDREQWVRPRRWQIWRKHWWAIYARNPNLATGVGRTVFEVCRKTRSVRVAYEVPQLLDPDVLNKSWVNQAMWAKMVTRGLRTLTCLSDGSHVVNDVFGVYQIDQKGKVVRYVSNELMSDLHCAIPNAANTRILVCSTACEEIIEVDWDGKTHRRFPIGKLFNLPPSPDWKAERRKNSDARTMSLNHGRELFHVNWAEWIVENETMLISCYVPGVVAIVDVRDENAPVIKSSWSYFPNCHGPWIDLERERLLVAVSKTDEVREVCTRTGATIWSASGIGYGKRVVPQKDGTAIAADCNGQRLVEIDRETGKITWEVALPGKPYGVTPVEN